jgi:cystine transport system substrate-binding protein
MLIINRLQLLASATGLLFAAALPAMAVADSNALDDVKKRGMLRIALEGTFPPFNYQDASGNLTGFEIDLGNALAKQIGVKAEFLPTKWDGILAGLDSGRYDVVLNQVTITPERQEKYDFSAPYTVSGIQIIVRRADADRIKTAADLAGKSVGVGLGTNYEQWLRKNVPTANVKTYDDDPTKFADLRTGRLDAVLADRLVAANKIKQFGGDVVAAGDPVAKELQGIAVRKDHPQLRDALDKALVSLHSDGTFVAISEKWFGTDVSK